MKIVNGKTKEEWDDVGLFLTEAEAKELRDALESIIADRGSVSRHEHVSRADYKREITVVISN